MKTITLMMLLICFLYSCKEYNERGQFPLDDVPPGVITSPVVKNVAGGAVISYTIPTDKDLLYVKAVYTLDNGVKMEQKASAYVHSLNIVGLGKSQIQTISIVTGDRSKNESKPVLVEIHPQDSPIYNIYSSIKIRNDFGGIRLDWDNPLGAEIVLTVCSVNSEKKYTEVQKFYSTAITGKGNIRGLPSVETVFAVFISDRWDNLTDTISGPYTPIFEMKADRTKFVRWNPTGIPYVELTSNYPIERLWDGDFTSNVSFYSLPITVVFPYSFTFNLGQTIKMSRFKAYQRDYGGQLYIGSNVKRFQVWGSDNPNVNQDFATWTKLGDFESIKPSGSGLGVVTADDRAYALAGEDYSVDISAPRVKYLRFNILETWGGTPAAQIGELEFFGDVK